MSCLKLKRNAIGLLGWLMISIFFLCGSFSNAAEKSAQPNVILVMTDDQGYGDFGFTGNPLIRTPHLDAMSERSASLAQFYVSPVCAPTRASLMTGRYNFRTRAIDTWNGHAMMDAGETTVAEVLQHAGYATGLFGKWHLGDNYPLRPQDQGFEEVLMHRGGGIGQPSDPDGAEGDYTNPVLFHNGERKQMKGYCTDVYFDHAKDWMKEMHEMERPFFVYLATNAPHSPLHDVPEDLYQEYKAMDLRNSQFPQEIGHPLTDNENVDNRARIYAMITNVDDNMGSLFQHLDRLGITNNTLVIFLVDNGPNGNRYVAGFKGRKTMVHEGGIRSPALFHWPAKMKAGTSVDRISAHIDLAPTILDACGVTSKAARNMDGRSVLPLLQKKSLDWQDRSIVIQAHRGRSPVLYHNFALRNQKWKLLHASGFQSEDFDDQPKFELYDMEKDPYEMKNLASKRPEILEHLKAEYTRWFVDVGNTRPDNYSAPRIQINPQHENPVVLTRQDGEHLNGAPFRPESIGMWRLDVVKPGSYAVRFRFKPVEKSGTAVLNLNGRKVLQPISVGDSEIEFHNVRLKKGPVDLLPILDFGDQINSPWKIDLSR